MRILSQGALEPSFKSLRLVEISGDSNRRGWQYGSAIAPLLKRFLLEELFLPLAREGVSKETALNYAHEHLSPIKTYSPLTVEMMQGIAEGSETSLDEVVLLNLHEEIRNGRASCPLFEGHCTSFGATGAATADGECYIGQNWDANYPREIYWEGDSALLIRHRSSDTPDYMAYAHPGFLGCAGMNSDGISLSWNTVPPRDIRVGIPTYVIISEILRARSMEQAVSAATPVNRAGCFNFVIADAKGQLCGIEATPNQLDILPAAETMGHANHYVRLQNRPRERPSWFDENGKMRTDLSTVMRGNRMDELLAESFGSIEVEKCMSFLRDHANYPNSICRHPATENNLSQGFDSWVMVPRRREWWIARFPQCRKEFTKHALP